MTDSDSKKIRPAKKATSVNRRVGSKQSAKRTTILDATEKLMLDEGYAAISTRRVAKDAGLKPPLVHYYFPTTDDLFLAVYRRAVEQELERLDKALASQQSLRALWVSYMNAKQTVLAMEFMALANHRKAIRKEIARLTNRTRRRRAEILSELLNIDAIKPDACSATGFTVLIIGVARTLVMERGLGISLGHDEASAFVEWWLEQLEK